MRVNFNRVEFETGNMTEEEIREWLEKARRQADHARYITWMIMKFTPLDVAISRYK